MPEGLMNPYAVDGMGVGDEHLMYPHELENKESGESTLLYSSKLGRVMLPTHPLVPPDGGVNLTVIPTEEKEPYYEPNAPIEASLPPFLLSLAAARAVITDPESGRYSKFSQWVNVHAIPRFGGETALQFEVTGKDAMNDPAWAMPVKYPKGEGAIDEEYPGYSKYGELTQASEKVDYGMYPVVKEEIDQIRGQLAKCEEDILKEADNAVLFEGEAPEVPRQEDKILLVYKNFEIMMAKANPHVEEGGLHLWVREASGRQTEGVQSDVHNALEQFIMAEAISKAIYKGLGRKIEIHFSSNWGLATERQQQEAVARGKDPEGNYIKESLSAHANLYAAPPDKDYVNLPERPAYTNPEIPEETRQRTKAALEQYLPGYLTPFEHKKASELIS